MLVAERYLEVSESILSFEGQILDLDRDFSQVEGCTNPSNPTESKEEKFLMFLRICYLLFSASLKSDTL